MKLQVSDKGSSSMKKPHIRKGYYPAKLVDIKPALDKEDKLKEYQYGHMLIFLYEIYKEDPETGLATNPITWVPEEGKEPEKVVLADFVYHEYKDKDTGKCRTAITPNSKITKRLKVIGWEFSPEGLETNELIGNFVEANVDDYTDAENNTSSSVKDINGYKGAAPVDKEPLSAEKQDQLEKLTQLHKDGNLTDEGFAKAKEQLEA